MTISNAAEAAREDARKVTGQFGEQEHSQPGFELGGGLDLSSHTPVDIDTRLAELYEEHSRILAPLGWREDDAEKKRAAVEKAEAEGERYEGQLDYLEQVADEADRKVAEIWAAADAKKREAAPYEAEFTARGGWTRAFLTTGTNGHVHSSMDCSTCNREGKVTRFAWMTDYSGADEQTIVEDAAERACTTCYPSAPVDVLSRPTKMFTPDEKRKQEEREAREAAKVERERKKIENALTPDGSEFVVYPEPAGSGFRTYGERFKTERAATIWATDQLTWMPTMQDPERVETHLAAVRKVAEAIAVKHGRPVEYVLGELQVKADLKTKVITKKVADQRIAELAAKYGVS